MAKRPVAECQGSHPGSDRGRPLHAAASVERAANLFRALGEPARLRLLSRLIDGPRCVGDLAAIEREAISTISQRLRVLRSEKIVVRHRQGKHVVYRLMDGHVKGLILNALAHAEEVPDRSETNQVITDPTESLDPEDQAPGSSPNPTP